MQRNQSPKTEIKRVRLSVDLDAYPDVETMLGRAEKARPGVSKTAIVIESLRRDLSAQGYARKKELSAEPSNGKKVVIPMTTKKPS